jgi:hypothetical protein
MAEETTADEKEKCPNCGTELKEEACPKDGCGYKKKKTDSSAPNVVRGDVFEDDWNFTMRDTPEGYLEGKAVVTNIGVFTYLNSDGTVRRELRHPDDVFSPESAWSIKGKPITNDHPAVLVTADNIREYAVGKTEGDPIIDAYHLAIGLVIDDKDTIRQIKEGKRALSCGYNCKLDWTPGTYLGVQYDARQFDIRYNHLSVVDRGRAGDAARMHIDSVEDSLIIHAKTDHKEVPVADETMRTISLDSVDYKAEDKVIDAYNASVAKSVELQSKIDGLTSDKSTVEAERDALKEKNAELQKQIDEKKDSVDVSKIDELVKARMALLDVAKKANVEVTDAMSEKDIMVAVITAKAPKVKLDGKDDVYIKTRFEIVCEDMAEQETADAETKIRKVNEPKKDEKKVDAEASRQAYIDRMLNPKKDGGK